MAGPVRFTALLLAFALSAATPVQLIVDTDIGGGGCADVDDVAAVCMSHALVDAGEVDLLAVVQDTSPALGAGVLSVLAHYYGHDHVPIGAYKGGDLEPNAHTLSYVSDLVDTFDSPIRNTSQVPSSTETYRRALAAAEDGTVVISSIGLLTAISALLKSPADDISTLTGYELVARKVRLLAVMGGKYPSVKTADGAAECNFCGCYVGSPPASDKATAAAATKYVVENMPPGVEVRYSGFEIGIKVSTGGIMSSCQPADNPCRRAFEDYGGGPNKNRFSWDPLSTLAAVRGVESAHCAPCVNCAGKNEIYDGVGRNEWKYGEATNSTFLLLADAKAAGEAVDELLCRPPASK